MRKSLQWLEPFYVGAAFAILISLKYPFYEWQFWAIILPLIMIWCAIKRIY